MSQENAVTKDTCIAAVLAESERACKKEDAIEASIERLLTALDTVATSSTLTLTSFILNHEHAL